MSTPTLSGPRQPAASGARAKQLIVLLHGYGADGDDLFGLYVGTPLTERLDYHMVLPDRILIFQGPHERAFPPDQLEDEIRRTVAHEVAHYFGIDDDRLDALGLG